MIKLKEDLQLPDIKVPMFILRFLNHLKEKGRAYGTYVRYGYYLEEFLEWMKKQKKTDITFEIWKAFTKEDYDRYYQHLYTKHHYSLDSLKRVESVFMQLYLYYMEKGFTDIVSPSLSLEQTYSVKSQLQPHDFVTEEDFEKLVNVMKSKEGLTEHQLKGRDFLINRNICIVTLFYKYGLTMKELVSLAMKDIEIGRYKGIHVKGKTGKRYIPLDKEDGVLIVQYLNDIPKPVRPKLHTDDPLFVAFDYQRLTYRWVYDNDDKIDTGHPKALSRLAVQKMILQEVRRAGLSHKGINAQSMRNSAILKAIQEGKDDQTIMKYFGLKTPITLRRYKEYLESIHANSLNGDDNY
jgi:site-specific recombinase XerD